MCRSVIHGGDSTFLAKEFGQFSQDKPHMKPYFNRLAAPFRRQLNAAVFMGVRSICQYMGIGHSTFYLWTRGYQFPATPPQTGGASRARHWLMNG